MDTGRYELKYHITAAQYEILRRRLAAALPHDPHAGSNGYRVDSLYFDDIHASAYLQKLNGEPDREKFRIRAYDGSDAFIRLECKQRQHGFIHKIAAPLTRASYDELLRRGTFFFAQ